LIKVGKLIAAESLTSYFYRCLNTHRPGNQHLSRSNKLAVSPKNEVPLRLSIPKEVSIPENVKVLSCVLVDKISVEGFKRYLTPGKRKIIYAIS